MSSRDLIDQANQAEFLSYLRYKKRVFEEVDNDTSSSGSSVSLPRVKKIKPINYFGGTKGQKSWSPSSSLIINNNNWTDELKNFRSKNIKIAESFKYLSSIRLLSLSHVFPVNKFDPTKCISTYVYNDHEKDLFNYAYQSITFQKASTDSIIYCKNLVDMLGEDENAQEIPFEPATLIDKMIKSTALEYASTSVAAKENSEAAFMQKHLLPLLTDVLKKSLSSSFRFSLQDATSSCGKCNSKPDVLLCFADRKREVDCFVVEVKRPNTTSKYQVEDDYTKLLKQLKNSYDYQLNLGILEPTCLGLLCEGFACSLIEMLLVEDGVYLPVVVRTFVLPANFLDLVHIPRAVETLNYALVKMQEFEEKYKTRNKKASQKKRGMRKPSFISVAQK